MFKTLTKLGAGMMTAGLIAVASAGSASAQSVTAAYSITNSFGATITLDTASCSPSGSISPPFSIASGSTASFTATGTASSFTCNVRYQNGANGCQFQIHGERTGTNGFRSTNAYKGAQGRPRCNDLGGSNTANGYSASFSMQ